MSGINNMIEVLDMISNGIDPLTGEVVDVENLKKDSAFQNALKKLIQTYRRTSTGGVYAQFEATYPKHAIIMTEGYFFAAHNKSAFVMNHVLHYKVALDYYKRPSTGGPDYKKISSAFHEEGISFLLVSKGELVEQVDGEDPFEKYSINEDACETFVSKEMGEYSANTVIENAAPKNISSKPMGYPHNLLKELLPDREEYPSDIANRLAKVLASERVFSQRYRRDAECISEYYESGRTMEEIGTEYGITRERIRQIIKRGLRKMSRKVVLSYLSGETETIEAPKSQETVTLVSTDKRSNLNDPPSVTEESISISELARRLSTNTPSGKTLRYSDISSWLIAVGDLATIEDDMGNTIVPTEQGLAHGIKRGHRVNAAGIEYVGIFLEPDAQKYLSDNLGNILTFLDRR